MAKFLITGARAPVTWDLAINLNKHGHQVYLADSLKQPVGKQCPAIERFLPLPPPKTNLGNYSQALRTLLKKYNIDFLLPTCEEIFYISKIKKELMPHAEILCSDIKILHSLHNKKDVLKFGNSCKIETPTTLHLHEISNLNDLVCSDYILKKEYCRFGNEVNLEPSFSDFTKAKTNEDEHNRYLLQEKVSGDEICCYAIITKRKVALCACYHPKYRVSQSASILFEATRNGPILDFLKLFAEKHNFSGQISFDFIQNEKDLFLIECNPRATSGIHLCGDANLATLLTKGSPLPWQPDQSTSAQIKLAMVMFVAPHLLFTGQFRQFLSDYHTSRDVFEGLGTYPIVKQQLMSLYELFKIAIKNRSSLRAASTADIDWDGEEISAHDS